MSFSFSEDHTYIKLEKEIRLMKKIMVCMIGIMMLFMLCSCANGDVKDLPDIPDNESSHNSSSGLDATMPEHEKATTDPDYFEKNGDKKTADEVKEKTKEGYDDVTGDFNEKNDAAERKMHQTENEYQNAKSNTKKDISDKEKQAEEELEKRREEATTEKNE